MVSIGLLGPTLEGLKKYHHYHAGPEEGGNGSHL